MNEQAIQTAKAATNQMTPEQHRAKKAQVCKQYPQLWQRSGESAAAYKKRTLAYLMTMSPEKRGELLALIAS